MLTQHMLVAVQGVAKCFTAKKSEVVILIVCYQVAAPFYFFTEVNMALTTLADFKILFGSSTLRRVAINRELNLTQGALLAFIRTLELFNPK